MRVAVVNLTRGGLSGGYLKYLRAMVPRLERHPGIEQLDVFLPEAARGALGGEPWEMRTWPEADARRGFADLKRAVRSCEPHVVFVPTAGWLDFGLASVAMVRNMEPLEAPLGGNPPREALKNLARRVVARRACRRADRVIAVSNHVQHFITGRWKVPPVKVAVVYHGVDAPDRMPPPVRPASLGRLDGPFFFTAGSIRPARGLADVIEALPGLKAAGSACTAVIAGRVDPGMDAHARRLEDRAQALGVADRLVWAGPLDAAGMRWCYESSAAFVMSSRAEACPNIALEAMSFGCACVAVDRPPMPEFFGSAASYYRAGDARGLATALARLLASPPDAAAREAAAARAATFDWNTTVERTVAELRTVVRS